MEPAILSKNNLSSIRHILTLRYDPNFTSSLPSLSWNDFEATISSVDDSFIEKAIQEKLSGQIKDNQKISISLSSGIDSTLIAILLRKLFPNKTITAISINFNNSFDETKQAEQIANKLEFEHRIHTVENFFENLPDAINTIQLPFWDLHWYNLAKTASSFSETLVSGDGGDELFAGYTFRYTKFLSLINSSSSTNEKIQAYLECHERDWVTDQENLFLQKFNFSWNEIFNTLKSYFDNSLSPITQVLLADYNGKLCHNMSPIYNLIHKKFNLGYVAPILSKELIHYSSHLENKYKFDSNQNLGKLPLRQLIKKHGFEKFVSLKKYGFSVDTKKLWLSEGQSLCKYFLDNARIIQDGWINKNWILKYIDSTELEYSYVNKFYGILAFEIWYRLFITKEMSASDTLKI